MTSSSIRWGTALSSLVLLLAQVAACGGDSPAKKAASPQAGAGGTNEGGSASGGSPSAGSAGHAPTAGSASLGGSTAEAGAPSTGDGGSEQAGAANDGGASSTAGTAGALGGAGGSGGTATSGGAAGAGTAGSGDSGGSACSAPSSTITTAATAVHKDTLVAASVPSQAGVSYAWSVLSGGTANGVTNKNTFAFDVGTTGGEVVLQAVVTSAGTSCASTSVLHIPIPCQVPVVVSADGQPAVPHYVIDNIDTGQFDMTSSSNIWAAYLVGKNGTASPDGEFNHFSGSAWAQPAGSPQNVNASAAYLLFHRVVTDTAGDAVFVWTQTVDNNNYTVMVSAYRVSDKSWSTPQQVGAVWTPGTPVDVKIDRATGTALIAWSGGGYNTTIPHLRSFTVSSGALGPDLPLRPSTTNTDSGDMMQLYLETNDALTGFATWFERDATSKLDAIYALHITNGVPDSVASAYDIKQLVLGTNNYMTDVLNQYTLHNTSFTSAEPRRVAVSANGKAAIVWSAYNGLSTETNKAQLYLRRYIAGAWSATELVTAQPTSISTYDWGIDNAGNVIIETWTGGAGLGYDFYTGVLGSPWATQHLNAATGPVTRVSVDSVSGKGMISFRDQTLGARAPLRGQFYDPTSHSLSPAFTMDDPTDSGGEVAHLHVDGSGLGTVLFTQILLPLQQGANSTNSALLFSTTCK